jgi:hypothetical protein
MTELLSLIVGQLYQIIIARIWTNFRVQYKRLCHATSLAAGEGQHFTVLM